MCESPRGEARLPAVGSGREKPGMLYPPSQVLNVNISSPQESNSSCLFNTKITTSGELGASRPARSLNALGDGGQGDPEGALRHRLQRSRVVADEMKRSLDVHVAFTGR